MKVELITKEESDLESLPGLRHYSIAIRLLFLKLP